MSALAPRSFPIANVFTGELLDPDDLPALKNALEEIEDYLAEKRRPLRRIYQARDQIQARVAQLDPITLPKRRWQTDKQQRVARCPHCSHVIEASDSGPQAAASSLGDSFPSGEGTSTSAVSTASVGTSEQSSESEKTAAAAGPAVGAEAPVPPQKQAPSPPAGDVPDGASPALPLEKP